MDKIAAQNWLYRPTFSKDWNRAPLYSLASWVNGLAFRDFVFSESGKPIIKIAEIKDGISSQTKFTDQMFDESVHVNSGDLLFSWSGQPETSIDAFWWRGSDGWLNQHSFRVTSNDGINQQFLYYLLKYLKPSFIGIARNKQTTGLGHVTKRDLQEIEAAYPSKSEQLSIASILGSLDNRIELNRQMNETLEQTAQALFKSWFVDFDPVRAKAEGRNTGLPKESADLFPDSFEDSALGEIPKGWRVSTIGEEVRVVGGSTPSTTKIEYWKDGANYWATPKDLSDIQSPVLLKTERKITDAGLEQISSGLLPIGTVLLSSRAPIGYLVISEIPVAINQGFIAMICEKALSNFYIQLWTRWNMETIKGRANGTTFQEISKGSFRPMPILVPSQNVLDAFNRIAKPLHERIAMNLKETRTLADSRDSLLPELLSGRVKTVSYAAA